MKHLKLPFTTLRRLPFYLAMEEWAARFLPPNEYFFCWRVEPTVICGRNQDMSKEVDMDYCQQNNIDVVRRKSGGGCVYADLDNFMFSYICPGDAITTSFAHYTTMIATMLRQMGLDASATGRNDIIINGKKVSGNAFYHLPGRCIAHGTMLYDIDTETMSKAITPSRSKLASKAVKSVQSRITSLTNEGLKLSKEEFEKMAVSSLCSDSLILDETSVHQIEEIEQTYYLPEFLNRKSEAPQEQTPHTFCFTHRFEGVGEIEATFSTDKNGVITNVNFSGDFFLLDDPEKHIYSFLIGNTLSKKEIDSALDLANPSRAIAGLTTNHLRQLIKRQ